MDTFKGRPANFSNILTAWNASKTTNSVIETIKLLSSARGMNFPGMTSPS